MTETHDTYWKDKYIELQREAINQFIQRIAPVGYTMNELNALRKLEEFENDLPWNKEEQ